MYVVRWNKTLESVSTTADHNKVTSTSDFSIAWGGIGSGKGDGSSGRIFSLVEGGGEGDFSLSFFFRFERPAFSLSISSFSLIFCRISFFVIRASAISGDDDTPIPLTDNVVKQINASLRVIQSRLGVSSSEFSLHLTWKGRTFLGASSAYEGLTPERYVGEMEAIFKEEKAMFNGDCDQELSASLQMK